MSTLPRPASDHQTPVPTASRKMTSNTTEPAAQRPAPRRAKERSTIRYFQPIRTTSEKPPAACSQKTHCQSGRPTRKEPSPEASSSESSARIARLVVRTFMQRLPPQA